MPLAWVGSGTPASLADPAASRIDEKDCPAKSTETPLALADLWTLLVVDVTWSPAPSLAGKGSLVQQTVHPCRDRHFACRLDPARSVRWLSLEVPQASMPRQGIDSIAAGAAASCVRQRGIQSRLGKTKVENSPLHFSADCVNGGFSPIVN